jgi:hypothetical protein
MTVIRKGNVDNPAGELWAYAFPEPKIKKLYSAGLLTRQFAAIDSKYYVIVYRRLDAGDLIRDLLKLLKSEFWFDPTTGKKLTGPTLRMLEISAHGSPTSLDGFDTDFDLKAFVAFGSKLAALRWNDISEIYLGGCNTGCREKPDEQGIAEQLAELIPAKPKQFRCTVYGAVGDLSGDHAAGNAETEPSGTYLWERAGHCVDNDPDPHMRPFRGYRGANSA